MRLSRSLLILWTLSGALAVSGCHSLTLVGSVNLGATPADNLDQLSPPIKDDIVTCVPKRPNAVTAEFAEHHFVTGHEPEWKATRDWFEKIGKLPTCP